MLDDLIEFLKSVGSNATADFLVRQGLRSAVRHRQSLWKKAKKTATPTTYYAGAATSLRLTQAALLWYTSLTAVMLYHQYVSGTQIPDYLHTSLSIGTGCLLAHALYTWRICGRGRPGASR